jgi:hypothetical protein
MQTMNAGADTINVAVVNGFRILGGVTGEELLDTWSKYHEFEPILDRYAAIASRSGRWNDPSRTHTELLPTDFAGIVTSLLQIRPDLAKHMKTAKDNLMRLARSSTWLDSIELPFSDESTKMYLPHIAWSTILLAQPSTILHRVDSRLLSELIDAEETLDGISEMCMPSNCCYIMPTSPMLLGKDATTRMWFYGAVVIADLDTPNVPSACWSVVKMHGNPGLILVETQFFLKSCAQILQWGQWDETDKTVDLAKRIDRKAFRRDLSALSKSPSWISYRTLNESKTVSSRPVETSGRKVSAHFRRGHWHRYRVGPRDEWQYERKFVRPVIVNAGVEPMLIARPVYK